MTDRRTCCATWDGNDLIAETPLMRLVFDAYPVCAWHMLIIPKRHVDRLHQLLPEEWFALSRMIDQAYAVCRQAEDFTVAVNDGPLAGRTVPHLHMHVIPRRPGDVPDPRGGVRRLLIPDPDADPWTLAAPSAVVRSGIVVGD